MKKIILVSIPLLLVACSWKPATPTITPVEMPTVSSEIMQVKEPGEKKPTTTSTKIPKKVTTPQETTPEPTNTINSDKDTDAMTEELDKLIDDIVGE
jgi:hypothetical protein